MQKITRIVIPVDNSEASRIATEQGAFFAKILNVELSIISVDETEQFMVSALLQKKIKDEKARFLSDIKKLAEENGVTASTRLTAGDPAKEIVSHVTENDLIIMASKEKTGYNKFLLGSVSEEVLRHAPCSVMIIKPTSLHSANDFKEK
ncbi:MAG: universal stress protein [Methanobacteriota archaeon]